MTRAPVLLRPNIPGSGAAPRSGARRIAGLGFPSTARATDLAAALATVSADAVAIPEYRAGHPALDGVTLPILPIPRAALAGVPTPSESPRIRAAFGTGSVAEALALVASGGTLAETRRVVQGVTIALAVGEEQT